MEIRQLRLGGVELPDVAGDLQRRGATASLVRELGDNYEKYHAFLARRLAEVGRPDPADYETFEEYAAAWTVAEDIVHAEVTLRACHGFRRFGKGLDAPASSKLVDDNDRLVAGS